MPIDRPATHPGHAPPVDDAPVRGAPGRPKDLAKGAAILEAARQMFIAHGFDGASMDQIAGQAGVSKLTVYSHFGDKDSLFAAAVRAHCEQKLPDALFAASPETLLRERLLEIAGAFFAMVTAPESVAGHRMLCTPKAADSSLPEVFWEAGPGRVQAAFADLLVRRRDAGELDVPDPVRAASQFFVLVKGDLHARMVFGCTSAQCRAAIQAHLEASVDLFLRGYATRRG